MNFPMDKMVTPSTSKDLLLKFVEDNALHFWSNLDVEIHYNVWSTKLLTGIPHALFNGVLRSQFASKNIGMEVEGTIEHYRNLGLPFTWWVSYRSSPRELGEVLREKGFIHIGLLPAMALIISERTKGIEPLKGLEILEISSQDDKKLWETILADSFAISRNDILTFCNFFEQKQAGDTNYKHYLGIYNSSPAAVGTLFLDSNTAGLYNIAVLPEKRFMGIGTHMMQYLIQKAEEYKARLVAMQSYPIVVESCHNLGFKRIFDFDVYVWNT